MPEQQDSVTSVEQHLEFLCDFAGVGPETITDRDVGEAVLEPQFESQLVAIRSVLERNHEVEQRVSAEIERLDAEIRDRGDNLWMENQRIDHLHSATFLDAAHSMAAVGLIAPLIESLFDRAFGYLKHSMGELYSLQSGHARWQLDDRWNHRFVWKRGRREAGIAKGIVQLAEAIDLKKHLPADLERTLSALFAYRNKMFHCGLEWPDKDLKMFDKLIDSEGWVDCFTRAESGGNPWIFYMSREFTNHCLETVDRIIEGIGARVRRELSTEKMP